MVNEVAISFYAPAFTLRMKIRKAIYFILNFHFHLFSHYRDLKVKRDAYIQRLNGIYLNNLSKSKVELIRGEGTFVDKNLVAVGDDVYSADHILIAVGGYPTWPSIPGAEHGISSDGFFELETLPKKVIKVGGGINLKPFF